MKVNSGSSLITYYSVLLFGELPYNLSFLKNNAKSNGFNVEASYIKLELPNAVVGFVDSDL